MKNEKWKVKSEKWKVKDEKWKMKSERWKVKDNPLKDKSYQFAIRIVKLSQFLQQEKKEFVLSEQVLRSGAAHFSFITFSFSLY